MHSSGNTTSASSMQIFIWGKLKRTVKASWKGKRVTRRRQDLHSMYKEVLFGNSWEDLRTNCVYEPQNSSVTRCQLPLRKLADPCKCLGICHKNNSSYWWLGLWGGTLSSYLSQLEHCLSITELLTTLTQALCTQIWTT